MKTLNSTVILIAICSGVFGVYGGDDETRTRDLCRDRMYETRNLLKLGVMDGSF